MSTNDDTESRNARIHQARQVLAGDAVRPSPDPWQMGSGAIPLSALQRNYLILLGILLLVGVALAWIVGLGLASAVLFLLAVGLVAAWLVF
jgi:hypothetical protein